MAAGINTTYIETVHKSTFALMGHAVPASALPCFIGIVSAVGANSTLHAFFIAASNGCR
ncbi:hypothetical protein HDF09_001264 [Edaphobacter lichenicola]|uniref:Uncharacterized protein n=1 Tax=Tunturiibacter empetritectus TaxID=3069691 RepID=A0A7W8IG64_9BACT|nr:hypothetical protein [Edaphobacter lichenicola]